MFAVGVVVLLVLCVVAGGIWPELRRPPELDWLGGDRIDSDDA
ncbi:hypothetical protein LI90_4329 (plasmid) [Carbonactinospora thermoautotrophica]|uniref:Uncharacterized protein n=1 Tax=Carbonactinospora thermoautotrophica TaxID=1469144 RepID=A0A132MHP4_9ACTN|nr:hypothetical protein LI90_4329 [Carbonactinospora thermoautotrophica]